MIISTPYELNADWISQWRQSSVGRKIEDDIYCFTIYVLYNLHIYMSRLERSSSFANFSLQDLNHKPSCLIEDKIIIKMTLPFDYKIVEGVRTFWKSNSAWRKEIWRNYFEELMKWKNEKCCKFHLGFISKVYTTIYKHKWLV